MSIFNDDNKVKANWFKFEKVGDRIEGTLIARREMMNQLRGEMQMIYEIMLENGEVWNVGSKKAIDIQMRRVREGQIVGFEFVEERKPSKPGLNKIKVVQVYANPAVVNEKWLKEQEEIGPRPTTLDAAVEEMKAETDIEDLIHQTAIQKIEGADAGTYKKLVMEKTGLAYIEANYKDILDKLNTL